MRASTFVRLGSAACVVAALSQAADGQVQIAKLELPGGGPSGRFGWSCAIDGLLVVGGAPRALGNGPSSGGSAVVFERTGNTFDAGTELLPSEVLGEDEYGYSVDVCATTRRVVIGAPDQNGASNDEGAVYVFDWQTFPFPGWVQTAKLANPDSNKKDMQFGTAVAVEGNRIVVGAPGTGGKSLVGPFFQADPDGKVFVFDFDGLIWHPTGIGYGNTCDDTQGDDVGYRFGSSVAIAGDRIAVGAVCQDHNDWDKLVYVLEDVGTGWSVLDVVGPFDDHPTGRPLGLAFDGARVYHRDHLYLESGGSWQQVFASNTPKVAAAMSGTRLMAGRSQTTAGGVVNAGNVYVKEYDGAFWPEESFSLPGALPFDEFGASIALAGNTAVMGVLFDETTAACNAGSLRVFDMSASPTFEDIGFGLPGAAPVAPRLWAEGSQLPGTETHVGVLGPASQTVFLVAGLSSLFAPFKGGTLVPALDFQVPLVTGADAADCELDGSGTVTLSFSWPGGLPAGVQLYLQAWMSSPDGPAGFLATQAVLGTTP